VEYKSGNQNLIANTLSIKVENKKELWVITTHLVSLVEELKASCFVDKEIQRVSQHIEKETVGSYRYHFKDKLLLYKEKMFLSNEYSFKSIIL
jgi:hypothetical protein